jgi:hypothetical protein
MDKLDQMADDARARICLKEIEKILGDHRCVLIPRVEILGREVLSTVLVRPRPEQSLVKPATVMPKVSK